MIPSFLSAPQPHRGWLNSEREIAFLHVMKTGGTSYHSFLSKHVETNGHTIPKTWAEVFAARDAARTTAQVTAPDERLGLPPGPGSLRAISGHFLIGDILLHFPAARIATLLRNPVDRVFSLHRFLGSMSEKARGKMREEQARISADAGRMGIDEWLEVHGAVLLRQIRDVYVYCLGGTHRDLASETPPDAHFEAARVNLGRLAFVGLTERMRESILLTILDNGLEVAPVAPQLNVTKVQTAVSTSFETIEPFVSRDRTLYRQAERLFTRRLNARLTDRLERIGRQKGARAPAPLPATAGIGHAERLYPVSLPSTAALDRAICFHDALLEGATSPEGVEIWLPLRELPVLSLDLVLAPGLQPQPMRLHLDGVALRPCPAGSATGPNETRIRLEPEQPILPSSPEGTRRGAVRLTIAPDPDAKGASAPVSPLALDVGYR